MAKAVIMPKFGFTQEESQIVEWLVAEGTAVENGDPIVEVTTDKINMEVEATRDGIVAGIRYQAGETVPVTEVIAYLLAPGEELPAEALVKKANGRSVQSTASSEKPAPRNGNIRATPVASRMAQREGVNLQAVQGSGSGGRIVREDVARALAEKTAASPNVGQAVLAPNKARATPAARRLARLHALPLAEIGGTGPRGRVQEADVTAFVAQQKAAQEAAAAQPVAEPSIGLTKIPFNNMRRTIARNLQASAQEAPHIYFQADVVMDRLSELVGFANGQREADAPKVTLTAVLAKAVGWAVQRHPLLNSHLVGEEIWQFEDVHIGLAVALDDGLIVPVLKNVTQQGISALSHGIRDLAKRARVGRLKPAEMQGATFSLSNLGMFGIDRFTAIINPPEVGILAVGRSSPRFLPDEDGQPVLCEVCSLTLSVDHRVVDGAVAAAFMADLRRVVEQPQLLVL